jgi:hypothetical protein
VIINQGGSNAAMGVQVWELANAIATTEGTPGFAYGFHSAAFNGPSTIPVTVNDIILASAFENGTIAINVTSATAYYPADYEASVGSAIYMSMSHLVLASPASTNANYTPASGTNFATSILALKP